jgi:hypothetical protein
MSFPAPVGTRPQRPREPLYTRDSNALRASVLDAALQLGVGTSRAVENLLFDSILEDDEVSIVLRACCSRFCALAFFIVNTSPSHQVYDACDRSLPPVFCRALHHVGLSKGEPPSSPIVGVAPP